MNSPASIRKATVLLSCLSRQDAFRLLDRLSPRLAGLLRQQRLLDQSVTLAERRALLREFLFGVPAAAASPRLCRIDPPHDSLPSFHFLSRLEPDQVAKLLVAELPQTRAVVLSQLEPRFAAQVLVQWPEAERVDVARRLAQLDGDQVPVLTELAESLSQIVARVHPRRAHPMAGREWLSEALTRSDERTRELLASTLSQCNLTAVASLNTVGGENQRVP